MTLPSRLPTTLVALAAATALVLTGCSAMQEVTEPTPTPYLGGGGSSSEVVGAPEAAQGAAGESSGLDQATADGLPGLGLVDCPTLEEYEYSPEGYRTVWHLVYTCTTRDAFDASTESLAGLGYTVDALVIGDGDYISDRNYFQADANGGSTEVQLNLTGWAEDLKYEIFVTITLP